MPFQPGPVKSLVLPEGNPSVPGFDSMVFGTELPSELKAYGYSAAMVFYHAAWDPTSTMSQVKYYFFAVYHSSISGNIPSAIDIGFVWVNNPAANSTGLVNISMNMFHDRLRNAVSSGIPGGNVNAFIALGNRLFIDTDNGVLEFRPSDLAYPRVGCINFANGFYNNTGGTFLWAKKTAVGTVHLQGVVGGPSGGSAAGAKVAELPYNTYVPRSGEVLIPCIANAQTNFVRVATSGVISMVNAIPSPASFNVVGSWATSP